MSILDIFGRQRILPEAKILAPGERMNQRVICPHCEKEIEEGHDMVTCARKGMSRRYFFGMLGATAAALALKTQTDPVPFFKPVVVAHAGDMFEVETLNPFTLAWGVAKDSPFRDDQGVVSTGGILEFHGQDVARPDKWLRVHRGLPKMNVLGIIDKITGKEVDYKIIPSEEADKRVGLAEKRVMQEHYTAARQIMAERRVAQEYLDVFRGGKRNRDWGRTGAPEPEIAENIKQQIRARQEDRADAINEKFGEWYRHGSVNRLAWGRPLARPKGTLPT